MKSCYYRTYVAAVAAAVTLENVGKTAEDSNDNVGKTVITWQKIPHVNVWKKADFYTFVKVLLPNDAILVCSHDSIS